MSVCDKCGRSAGHSYLTKGMCGTCYTKSSPIGKIVDCTIGGVLILSLIFAIYYFGYINIMHNDTYCSKDIIETCGNLTDKQEYYDCARNIDGNYHGTVYNCVDQLNEGGYADIKYKEQLRMAK